MTTRLSLSGVPRALTASAAASLAGLLLAMICGLVVWLDGRDGSPMDALGTGLVGWLFVHGASLEIRGATVSITPLGGSLFAVWLLAKAVSRSRNDDDDGWLLSGLATIAVYTVAAMVVGAAVGGGVVVADDLVVTTLVIATVGTAIGLREAWLPALPDRIRSTVRGVVHAFMAMALVSLAMVVAVLIGQRDRFFDIWNSLDPGILGGIALAVFCLAWLPNLAAWAVSMMLGPGFALGVGTNVDLAGAQLGQVPAVPILAGVPQAGSFPGWAFALATVPVLAGLLAGWRVAEDAEAEHMTDVILDGVLAGAIAGALVSVAVALSGGAIGPGLMAETGPGLWPLLALGPVVFGFGGGLGAAASHLRTSVASD